MIIELRKYNEVRELLIETETTGSWGHVCYWDTGQKISVTMAAVCKGRKETGCKHDTGVHTVRCWVGN